MQAGGHGDDGRVEALGREHRGVVGVRVHLGAVVEGTSLLGGVGDGSEADAGHLVQDAGVIGAEAESDNTDAQVVAHVVVTLPRVCVAVH